MQQMASVEYTENVTEDQLEAMAGGEAIRSQATAFGVTRNNKVGDRLTYVLFEDMDRMLFEDLYTRCVAGINEVNKSFAGLFVVKG